MDDGIEDWIRQVRERAEKRQEKLYPSEPVPSLPVTSESIATEQEVSYPPLSPLPEEEPDSLSMAQTDNQDESSLTDYKRENTSPSQLDYSSDLSLECEAETSKMHDFYRAEPVVCHSSPDNRLHQAAGSRQASPRKVPYTPSKYGQPQGTISTMPTQRSDPLVMNPLQERQLEPTPRARSLSADQLVEDLAQKIDRTESNIKQLSKAVTYSKIGSKEHIEAARLLKIGQVNLHNFKLQKLKLDNGIGEKADTLASLKLYNIGFEARAALKEDLALDGVFHYFFCVASCGPEAKATATIDTNHIRAQKQKDYILFKDTLSFADLPPDFDVHLQVFEYVKKPMKFVERTMEVLSTPKKSRPTLETEFRCVAFIKLTKDDNKNAESKTLKFEHESKYISRRVRFQMELHPERMPSKAGMLHQRVLDHLGHPDWSRVWVDLSEGKIRVWKSKQDAMDKEKPKQTIDLKDLCSDMVQRLTPDDVLYRQHSFVFYETDLRRGDERDTLLQRILDDGNKVIKHQFAASNKEERDSWCYLLDKSMNSFREWNGSANVHSVEEFKELF